VPDSQSDDDRRADRGILARDRRSSDATETDPDTADAETSDADTEGTGTTASGTDSGAADTEKPEGSGADDDATAAKPARAISRRDRSKATPDPITDMAAREREAGVDELFPFGRPGRPLTRSHPFVFGFYGALGVLVAYMLVQALTNALQVIILIIVALFLAVGLNPGVEALERLGISRRWAVLLVFLALVGFFVGFGFAIVPPLSQQTSAIIHNLTSGNGYLEQLQNNPRLQDLDHRYHLLQKARTALQSKDLGTRAANGAVGVGQVVLSGLFSTLTVLILTLYFLNSLPSITGFMYRLAPRSRRARVALLGDEILVRIGGYVAGNLLISLIAGVTSYIFLLIAGVPYALALALLVAITDLIPLVGASIGAVFVTALSFFTGLWTGIATGIFFLIYQQVENYIVQPRVMKRSVDVQPAVTIIAALIGGALLGVIGALLAIPAAAAIALILREVVMPRQEQE
jgi:predicted PurR-regulated permease PerM